MLQRRWTTAHRAAAIVLSLVVSSCIHTGPASTGPSGVPAVLPSAPAVAAVRFPSRNGTSMVTLPDPPKSVTAFFPGISGLVQGSVAVDGNRLAVSKPLTATASGSFTLMNGDTPLAAVPYTSDDGRVELSIRSGGLLAPFLVQPIEAQGRAGDRSIGAVIGQELTLVMSEGRLEIGRVTVQADGTVSSVPGRLHGGPASLSLETQPVALDAQGLAMPTRLQPFETAFRSGSRQIHVVPTAQAWTLAMGDPANTIGGIQLDAKGEISQPDGLLISGKGQIRPAVLSLAFDANGATVPWRLDRYEAAYTSGTRSLAYFKGDRQLRVLFARDDIASPTFDPAGALPSFLKRDGGRLVFNLTRITLKPGILPNPTIVTPFETTPSLQERSIDVLPGVTRGEVYLPDRQWRQGAFHFDANSELVADTPSLVIAGKTMQLRTIAMQIETGGSPRAYRIVPYETTLKPGNRTVIMVCGTKGGIETGQGTLSFSIDGDGNVSGEGGVQGRQGSMIITP